MDNLRTSQKYNLIQSLYTYVLIVLYYTFLYTINIKLIAYAQTAFNIYSDICLFWPSRFFPGGPKFYLVSFPFSC